MYLIFSDCGGMVYVAKDKEDLKGELKAYFRMICKSEYMFSYLKYDRNRMDALVDEIRIVEEDGIEQAKKTKEGCGMNIHFVGAVTYSPIEIFGLDFYTEMLDYVTDTVYKTKE